MLNSLFFLRLWFLSCGNKKGVLDQFWKDRKVSFPTLNSSRNLLPQMYTIKITNRSFGLRCLESHFPRQVKTELSPLEWTSILPFKVTTEAEMKRLGPCGLQWGIISLVSKELYLSWKAVQIRATSGTLWRHCFLSLYFYLSLLRYQARNSWHIENLLSMFLDQVYLLLADAFLAK